MATTENGIQYDIRFFDEFYPLLKDFGDEAKRYMTLAVSKGLISKDAFMEQVFSDISGIPRNSMDGMDFQDQSDLKTVVGQIKNNHIKLGRWTHSFFVQGVNTKVGALRVIAYNKLRDDFHYFYIPNSEFQHCKYLEIIIETSTCKIGETPQFTGEYQPRCRGTGLRKWWEFEVPTIQDLI